MIVQCSVAVVSTRTVVLLVFVVDQWPNFPTLMKSKLIVKGVTGVRLLSLAVMSKHC